VETGPNRSTLAVLAAAAVVAIVGVGPAAGAGGTPSGSLYFTTFRPAALHVASLSAGAGKLTVGTPKVVARLPGADGLEWAPDGDLLVGGEGSGMVAKVRVTDGAVQTQPAGLSDAYQLSLSPDRTAVFTGGLPGGLAKVPLNPFARGLPVALHGDDLAVSAIGFAPSGAFYTTGNRKGVGNFGRFDRTTGETMRTITALRGAHGFVWDPYSQTIVLVGSYSIVQVDPAQPDAVISERIVPGMNFDQGVADGAGHLYFASNTGSLVWVDLTATRRVRDATVRSAFLETNLDDVALSGAVTADLNVSSRAASRTPIVIGGLAALAAALVGGLVLHRRSGRA
jgi:hypothetical protein